MFYEQPLRKFARVIDSWIRESNAPWLQERLPRYLRTRFNQLDELAKTLSEVLPGFEAERQLLISSPCFACR